MDDVHVPYSVALDGTDEGWLHYVARRDGEHVVFLGHPYGSAVVQLRAERLDEDGWLELAAAGLEMAKPCQALEQGYMLHLEAGMTYRLIIRRLAQATPGPIELFVEHLGSFGGTPLSERCP